VAAHAGLPERSTVAWRRPIDAAALRSRERLWTLSTAAYSVPFVATAAILVGVDALKELPIALLLRPIGFDTLPVWTYNHASESRFEQAALPALTIIAAALIPVALLSRGLDRKASS
jgi:ABC-type Fe3+ transport system permease subunit